MGKTSEGSLKIEDIDMQIEITINNTSVIIGEKEAVKIINHLTNWIDKQRIKNNEKIMNSENTTNK
jgi:hypothetical protein